MKRLKGLCGTVRYRIQVGPFKRALMAGVPLEGSLGKSTDHRTFKGDIFDVWP